MDFVRTWLFSTIILFTICTVLFLLFMGGVWAFQTFSAPVLWLISIILGCLVLGLIVAINEPVK